MGQWTEDLISVELAVTLDGLFRQPDDVERGQAVGQVRFDRDQGCFDAERRAAVGGG